MPTIDHLRQHLLAAELDVDLRAARQHGMRDAERSVARVHVAGRTGQLLFSALMVMNDRRRYGRPRVQWILLAAATLVLVGCAGPSPTPSAAAIGLPIVTAEAAITVASRLAEIGGPVEAVEAVSGRFAALDPFAHNNPAITCSDGSFHEIDLKNIGYKLTTCLDGTE